MESFFLTLEDKLLIKLLTIETIHGCEKLITNVSQQ